MDTAIEESTYIISIAFYDDTAQPVTPNEVHWTLSDGRGNIINERANVAATPAPVVDVVLSGPDLAMTDAKDRGRRRFTVRATYDSDAGTDMPLNQEATFNISRLVNVPVSE